MQWSQRLPVQLLPLLAFGLLLLAGCAEWFRASPIRQQVMIGEIVCTDAEVRSVVRNSIAERILGESATLILIEKPSQTPYFTVSATVSFGHGASAGAGAFSDPRSSAGDFVNDISCVARSQDGKIFAISHYGQKIGKGGSFEPPSYVALSSMDDIISKLTGYARSMGDSAAR